MRGRLDARRTLKSLVADLREEKKERVKVKGFSAYKDNTMPIEAKKEEEKKE